MAETLTPSENSGEVPIDPESIQSRLKELWEMRTKILDSSPDAASDDMKKLLGDCTHDFQEKVKRIDAEDGNVASLGLEDLEAYIEALRKEICSSEEENLKISSEIDTLTKTVFEGDMALLTGGLEALACSLKLIQSEGLHYSSCPDNNMLLGETYSSGLECFNGCKFEILDLERKIEKNKTTLSTLQDLDYALKRVDAIGQLEYMLSEVRVIEFQGNFIRLSLRTPIPALDDLLFRQCFNCQMEPSVSEHELLIEVIEKTMELKNAEIFPCDVFIEGLLDSVKSSRDLIYSTARSLGWFIRKVQHRIVLCMLRRLLVKDASNSRHTFEYSDRENTVAAHLVGGIDAFIKLNQDWPISNPPLQLLSIKVSDHHSTSISLSFFCKVKEMANSLDMQTRCHLLRFVDAIEEILVHEMQSELH